MSLTAFNVYDEAEDDDPRLRDYQRDVNERVLAEFEAGAKRVIIQMGTGAGKTVSAAGLSRFLFDQYPELVGGWMVHTKGLRTQAKKHMERWGVEFIDWSTIPAQKREWRYGRMHAFGAMMKMPRMLPNARTFLVSDECQRSPATTVARHIDHARWDWGVGLSGTPARRGWPNEISESHARFANQWDAIVCGPTLQELVVKGALADVILRNPREAGGDRTVLRTDKMRDSGYTAESEQEFERTLSLDAAARFAAALPARPTVWFCSSQRGARRLNRLVPSSAVVLSNTPETRRQEAYHRFNAGELMNLISVGVLVEGVDLPIASRVVLLRPSTSRTLLSQMCGRGMRPPGDVEIYDFAGSFMDLGAHPLDDLPWHEVLSGRIPDPRRRVTSKPKVCPTPGCNTILGPMHNRLCPTCYAEVGRWCVACERALVSIEDRAHRRCHDCAESEREMHRLWAEAHGVEPVVDRDAADDLERSSNEVLVNELLDERAKRQAAEDSLRLLLEEGQMPALEADHSKLYSMLAHRVETLNAMATQAQRDSDEMQSFVAGFQEWLQSEFTAEHV